MCVTGDDAGNKCAGTFVYNMLTCLRAYLAAPPRPVYLFLTSFPPSHYSGIVGGSGWPLVTSWGLKILGALRCFLPSSCEVGILILVVNSSAQWPQLASDCSGFIVLMMVTWFASARAPCSCAS